MKENFFNNNIKKKFNRVWKPKGFSVSMMGALYYDVIIALMKDNKADNLAKANTMDVREETKYRNGEEFMMSLNNRLNQMQMKAAVPNSITEFKKELELKEERRREEIRKDIAKISQNNLSRGNFSDIPENILKIYLPDDATIARELWRIKEYAEDLDTIKEEAEEDLYTIIREEDTTPEFSSGLEFLNWVEGRLSYLEPFLPEFEVHHYFFRQWSRDDFSYTPWLETLFEEESMEQIAAEIDDEDIKPEFSTGEEYLSWLGRQLPCLEPFVGDHFIHSCFKNEWRKGSDYKPGFDTVIEEHYEEGKESRANSPVKDNMELENEELNPYIKLMLLPSIRFKEVLMTQNPLSLVEICSKSITTELATDGCTSGPENETSLIDTKQQTDQICKKGSKWNLSFKLLCRNKKENGQKKRSAGFFSRFFH
ncbi:uncharacterized protein LOC134251350 [Saccostrea cucullata]|uniref:uncharacterized protein LOC134251350 n=1 Tax=Saccostrea cuccullata TaxID=36930 RepID=UPI002ED5DE85